jgi:hypothetical protein
LPLEEVAAIFGDADEVAIYQKDLEVDLATHTIIDRHAKTGGLKGASMEATRIEKEGASTESSEK